MIRALSSLLVITLAAPSHEQSSTPLSPCPNVFMYEPSGTEPGRWYGVVNLSTDSILHSLWLNIVLDSKADILGNWVGDVTTTDNIDFKIENTKMKIHPGPAQAVRFFVQYNPLNKPPKLQTIRLNGREICNANLPLPAVERPETDTDSRPVSRPDNRPENRPDSRPSEGRPTRVETTVRPVSRPDISASRPSSRPRPDESRPIDRETSRPGSRPEDPIIRPEDRPNTKPVYGRPSGEGPVYVPTESTSSGNANPYSIGGGQVPSQSIGTQTNSRPHRPADVYQGTTSTPARHTTTPRRPIETDFDDNSDSQPHRPEEYQATTAKPGRHNTSRPAHSDFDSTSDSQPHRQEVYQSTPAVPVRQTTSRRPVHNAFDDTIDSQTQRPEVYQSTTAKPSHQSTSRRPVHKDFDYTTDSHPHKTKVCQSTIAVPVRQSTSIRPPVHSDFNNTSDSQRHRTEEYQSTSAKPVRQTTPRRPVPNDFDDASDGHQQRPEVYQRTTAVPVRQTTSKVPVSSYFDKTSNSQPHRPEVYRDTTMTPVRHTSSLKTIQSDFDDTRDGSQPRRSDVYQDTTAIPVRQTTPRRQVPSDFNDNSDGQPQRPEAYLETTSSPVRYITSRRPVQNDFDDSNDSQPHRPEVYQYTTSAPGLQTTSRLHVPNDFDDSISGSQPYIPEVYQDTTDVPAHHATFNRPVHRDFDDTSDSQRHRPEVYQGTTVTPVRDTTFRRLDDRDFDDSFDAQPTPQESEVYQGVVLNRPSSRRPPDSDFNDNTGSKPDPDDYFTGGQPTFIVSGNTASSSGTNYYNPINNDRQYECGKVVRNNPNPLVVNGKPTLEGQWPWQIALYQTQTVDNKYICGGTLVSRQHVITAAHCITRKGSNRIVNKNTLTVYLGKHNLRTSVEGVQIKLVNLITVHPQYNASAFSKDLSILTLRDTVSITDWVRPACLWPENEVDLTNVIGKRGSVVGWGFDNTGVATEELTLVEMPVVDQETCIRSYSEFFSRFTSEYTFCAGYRNGTSVCNGDSGGGMVFSMQNTWYLRGLVSLSVARQNEYRCDPTHYVVFTDLAKFLPWIKDHVDF